MGLLARKYGLKWGRIHGALKCTPDQALRNWGFAMKPEADGVFLRTYKYTTSGGLTKRGTFVNNYVEPTQPNTPAQTVCRNRFTVLRNIARDYNCEIIRDIWTPEVARKSKKPLCGYSEFMHQNLIAIGTPPDYTKMRISVGRLEPTSKITSIDYDSMTGATTVSFASEIYRNGQNSDRVALFVHLETTHQSWHFTPPTAQRIDSSITVSLPTGLPIGFLIFFVYLYRPGTPTLYSPSISS